MPPAPPSASRCSGSTDRSVPTGSRHKPLGLKDEQIAATVNGAADDPVWSQRDALLVRLADELHDTCGLTDGLWSALADRFSDDQLLELVITAGWSRLLSYVINAARIEHEPWAARFPTQ